MSSSPFRATVDMTGEQQAALDLISRRTGRSRNALIREAIDRYLAPPAEAARVDTVETVPPSAPVSSRAASAGGRKGRVSTRWCSPSTHSIRGRE